MKNFKVSAALLSLALLSPARRSEAAPDATGKSPFAAEFADSHSTPDAKIDGDFVRGRIIEDAIAEIAKENEPKHKAELLERLGGLYATMEKTLPNALETYQAARKLALAVNPSQATELLAKIGIIYLRQGELANCTLYHNRDSCVFPLSGRAVHKDKTGSQAALESFRLYLKERPDDAHIEWLSEVALMTLGDPKAKAWVEKNNFIPAGAKFPRFFDVAAAIGISPSPMGAGGVLVEDFNGDGYLDVVISSTLVGDPLRYFENDGNGHFIDKSKSSHLDRFSGVLNMNPTDYNNDGKIDIYLSRRNSRGLNRKLEVFNSLLRNNGDGTFTDVTEEVGLLGKPNSNVAAGWADYDNDGWLDLFVCNENRGPDLFHNDHGHFTQVIDKSGIDAEEGGCGGAVWGDVNNDGYPDLFLTHLFGKNELYLNQKNGTFKRSPQPLIEQHPRFSYDAMFLDYDNDGWLDLFVTAFDQNINHMLLSREGKPYRGDHQRLYRNKGDGTFVDVTDKVGLNKSVMVMGANFGDIDNSGYPSIFLGTGGHSLGDVVPNVFYLNQEGKHFADVSVPGGFSSLRDGHAVAFTDLDNDGQPDIVMSLGGAYDSDRFFPQVLRNPGFPNHWITLRLKGTKPTTNVLGIGARVKATILEKGKERTIYSSCGKGATFGANSLQVHLGLGKATELRSVEISWPGDPVPQVFRDVKMDTFYRAIQGEAALEPLGLKKLSFSMQEQPHHHRAQ